MLLPGKFQMNLKVKMARIVSLSLQILTHHGDLHSQQLRFPSSFSINSLSHSDSCEKSLQGHHKREDLA